MNRNVFFSPENMKLVRAKIREDQIKAQKELDQNALYFLDEQKERIRMGLATNGADYFSSLVSTDKFLICSWFASNGLTCDKDVFVNHSCAYDTCTSWTASLKPLQAKTLWQKIFDK